MPAQRIDPDVVSAITKLMLGRSPDVIKVEDNVSEGSLHLLNRLLIKGFGEAKYLTLKSICRMAEKNDIPLEEIEEAYRLAVMLKMADLKADDITSWLADLFKAFKDKMDVNQFADLMHLANSELKGEDPKKLPQKIKELNNQRTALAVQLEKEKGEIAKIQATKQTEKESLAKILKEISDATAQAEKLKESNNKLAEQAKDWENKIKKLMLEHQDEQYKLGAIKENIELNQLEFNEYIDSKDMGFGINEQRILREKLVAVMEKRKIDGGEAVRELISHLPLYDEMVGFEKAHKEAESRLRKLNLEESIKQKNVDNLHSEELRLSRTNKTMSEINDRLEQAKDNALSLPAIVGTAQGMLHDLLNEIDSERKQLQETQKQAIASIMPSENLEPIKRLMSGERTTLLAILKSLLIVIDALLKKMPRNDFAYTQMVDVNNKILQITQMLPPSYVDPSIPH